MFYVYALYSEQFDKIYIGFSADAQKRLASHNDQLNTGWTAKYKPWKIIYTEEFENKTAALKREKQLKTSAGRRFIHGIVEKRNAIRQQVDDNS
ncbi:hypothetical protein MASR2M47_15850 [Draconibacterium sp.]|jgi:putative endonuclease